MKKKNCPSTLAKQRGHLSQYRGLLREIQAGRLELSRLSAKLLRLDPLTQEANKDRAREIRERSERLSADIECCRRLLEELEAYIAGIEDYELRRIFTLRYIHAYSWRKVAFAIGKYEESYPRKRHDRYIERRLEEEKDLH